MHDQDMWKPARAGDCRLRFTSVACGAAHTLCIAVDTATPDQQAAAFSFGSCAAGRLGIGYTEHDVMSPERISLPGRPVFVACGAAHSAAILDDGGLVSATAMAIPVEQRDHASRRSGFGAMAGRAGLAPGLSGTVGPRGARLVFPGARHR